MKIDRPTPPRRLPELVRADVLVLFPFIGTLSQKNESTRVFITQLLACADDADLLTFLRGVKERPKIKASARICFPCLSLMRNIELQEDFLHWADVLDRFDSILAAAAPSAGTSSDAIIDIYEVGSVRLRSYVLFSDLRLILSSCSVLT